MNVTRLLVIVAVGVSAWLSACVAPQTVHPTASADASDGWADVYATQRARLERLQTFSSSGQFTLRWSEDDERRWEQVDLRLWWTLPNEMALRLSRVGRRLAVAGWSEKTWWIFDQMSDETTLSIFDATSDNAGQDLLLSPPVLLAVAGIMEFPIEPPEDLIRAADGTQRFSMKVRGLEGSTRARLTLDMHGPTSVWLEREDGTLIARSELSAYKPVKTTGIAKGAWPMLPFRIRVFQPSATGPEGEASISIDRPEANVSVPRAMFDLATLQKKLAPTVVDDRRGTP